MYYEQINIKVRHYKVHSELRNHRCTGWDLRPLGDVTTASFLSERRRAQRFQISSELPWNTVWSLLLSCLHPCVQFVNMLPAQPAALSALIEIMLHSLLGGIFTQVKSTTPTNSSWAHMRQSPHTVASSPLLFFLSINLDSLTPEFIESQTWGVFYSHRSHSFVVFHSLWKYWTILWRNPASFSYSALQK